jgi:hypothetical protein
LARGNEVAAEGAGADCGAGLRRAGGKEKKKKKKQVAKKRTDKR